MPSFGNRTLRSIALAGVAVLAVAAQPAYAATSTSSLSVDATVTANCSVTTAPVNFGNVNVLSGANVDGEVYLTGLQAANRAVATWSGGSCEFHIAYFDTGEPQPRLGDVQCRSIAP